MVTESSRVEKDMLGPEKLRRQSLKDLALPVMQKMADNAHRRSRNDIRSIVDYLEFTKSGSGSASAEELRDDEELYRESTHLGFLDEFFLL